MTRKILDEYTIHFKRQRLIDQSLAEFAKRKYASLADCVSLDRLDRVVLACGTVPQLDTL